MVVKGVVYGVQMRCPGRIYNLGGPRHLVSWWVRKEMRLLERRTERRAMAGRGSSLVCRQASFGIRLDEAIGHFGSGVYPVCRRRRSSTREANLSPGEEEDHGNKQGLLYKM